MTIRTSSLVLTAILALVGAAAGGASPEEAKELGRSFTPVGAIKAGNEAGTIPEYTGGLTAPPAGFKKRLGSPPRPLRRREAPVLDRRQEHGPVRRQAHRGHEGHDAEVPGLSHRRLPDTPNGGRAGCGAGGHRQERRERKDRQGRTVAGERPRRLPVPDPERRVRGDVEPSRALQRRCLRDPARVVQHRLGRQAVARAPGHGHLRLPVLQRGKAPGGHLLQGEVPVHGTTAPRRRRRADPGAARLHREGAPGLAVPAGTTPREARPGHRLRHAEPRDGRRELLRRHLPVQRIDGALQLHARRPQGGLRSVQRLRAELLPGGRQAGPDAEAPQPGHGALGVASRLGGRRNAARRQATHLQQAHLLSRRGFLDGALLGSVRQARQHVSRRVCVHVAEL